MEHNHIQAGSNNYILQYGYWGKTAFSFSKKVLDHKADRLPPSKVQVEKQRPSVSFTVHIHETVLDQIHYVSMSSQIHDR